MGFLIGSILIGKTNTKLRNIVSFIANSLVAQMVKCLPGVQETWVRFLGREYPLEKEMETHSSILAWRIPGTEEPGRVHGIHVAANSCHLFLKPIQPAQCHIHLLNSLRFFSIHLYNVSCHLCFLIGWTNIPIMKLCLD